MEVIEVLRQVSKQVYDNVKNLAGTEDAAGYLLIKESGGLIVDADSQPLDSDFGTMTRLSFVGAANQGTLDQIMSEINK